MSAAALGLADEALTLSAANAARLEAQYYPSGVTDPSAWWQIAQGRIMDSRSEANVFCESARFTFRVKGNPSRIAFVIPGWWWDRQAAKQEKGFNGAVTLTLAFEYPVLTVKRLTFGGREQVIMPDFSFGVVSDFIDAPPSDTLCWGRIWIAPVGAPSMSFITAGQTAGLATTTNSLMRPGYTSVPQNGYAGVTNGSEYFKFDAANIISDYTLNQSLPSTPTAQVFGIYPLAIIGDASPRPTLLIGNSICHGGDDTPDNDGHIGYLARSIGGSAAYINAGSYGDALALMRLHGEYRRACARYTKNAIVEYAVNDLEVGRSLAKIKTDLVWLWSDLAARGQRVFQTTITPKTISTVAISTLTSSGTTATATIPATQAAALSVGQTVQIAGATPAGYNGNVVVSGIAGQAISYTLLAGASNLGAASVLGTMSDLWASAAFQSPTPTRLAINGLTSSGTTATCQMSTQTMDLVEVGSTVVISGVTPAGYNGTVVVTSKGPLTFTYTLPGGASNLAQANPTGYVALSTETAFSFDGTGNREKLNDWLRDGSPLVDGAPAAIGTVGALRMGQAGHPLYGLFEVADVVETARNSGRWKTDGTIQKYTKDGIHPNQAMCIMIRDSGAIDPTRLVA